MRKVFPPNKRIRNQSLSGSQVCKRLNLWNAPTSTVTIRDYLRQTVTVVEPVQLFFPTMVQVKLKEEDLSLTYVDAYGFEVRYLLKTVKVPKSEPLIPPEGLIAKTKLTNAYSRAHAYE